jgi:hypothetical protein
VFVRTEFDWSGRPVRGTVVHADDEDDAKAAKVLSRYLVPYLETQELFGMMRSLPSRPGLNRIRVSPQIRGVFPGSVCGMRPIAGCDLGRNLARHEVTYAQPGRWRRRSPQARARTRATSAQ